MSRAPRRSSGLFVTGTDTGVGKTRVACALAAALAARGLRVAAMKPVASGCLAHPEGWRSEDALALQAAANVSAPYALVNPCALSEPVAPHLAAGPGGIPLPPLLEAFRELAARAEAVVVEGVGGFRVPLDEQRDTADLAAALGLPVVLVVGLRLGCLNHALLTAEAVAARGLDLAGWVANRPWPEPMAREAENVATLERLLPAPRLGLLPHRPEASPAELASHLDPEPLLQRLRPP